MQSIVLQRIEPFLGSMACAKQVLFLGQELKGNRTPCITVLAMFNRMRGGLTNTVRLATVGIGSVASYQE